jgi:hypothetical protein
LEEITEVYNAEDVNYRTAMQALGDSVSLVEDLIDLYKLLGQMIKESGVNPHDDIVSASQFLLACRYQLTLGALALLRGHLSDSFYFARKAIELCAFAARVKKHPHLAWVWLRAGDNRTSYEKYREKFSPGKLFPEDHTVLGILYDRYDLCSKHSHPSIFSLAGQIETKQTATKFSIKFNYFELDSKDSSEPIRTLLWAVDTHFLILKVFEEILADVIVDVRTTWEIKRNAVEGKIILHRDKWKSVFMS